MASYTQEIYRKLLDSASFPGKLNNINNVNIENNTKLSNGALGLAVTLLDQEVTFYIENCTQVDIKNIRAITMSNQVNYNKSDYLFLDIKSDLDISQVKKGTFEYPDESTTIIHQVNNISDDSTHLINTASLINSECSSIKICLRGPGIKSTKCIYVDGIKEKFLKDLVNINQDYPIGVDLILIDNKDEILFIPRSSKMNWEVL